MASIYDVARHAGVSSATVSRVLAGSASVNAQLRDRVLKAVSELNYRPNRIAQSLRAQKSTTIGVIIPDIQNEFYMSIVRAIEDIAYESRYRIILCNSDEDIEKEAHYLNYLLDENIAGVILAPAREENPLLVRQISELARETPLVALDRKVSGAGLDTVLTNNFEAAWELISHLIEEGHKSIGAILGSADITTGRERRAGYIRALADHGIPFVPELLVQDIPKEANGYKAARQLLTASHRPTALFTGNSQLTAGALRAIAELNLSIPCDIAIAGFDDIHWTRLVPPGITAVAQPIYELGRVAATLLMERIENPTLSVREVVLKNHLMVRKSSMFCSEGA